MDAPELFALLSENFPSNFLAGLEANLPQPAIGLAPEGLLAVMAFLRENPALYCDFLESVSGVDLHGREDALMVVYHLRSVPFGHRFVFKCKIPRTLDPLPTLPSVAHLWRTADWMEREIYDLFGIRFENHPDLRRIFLPEDWQGFPLRKDYETADSYRDIRIDY